MPTGVDINIHARSAVSASFLLTLMTLACQPDDPGAAAAGVEIRDSAGIRIVENPRPPEGSRLDWHIGPFPTVSIGEVHGEDPYLLQGALDATRLGDILTWTRDELEVEYVRLWPLAR